MTADSDAFEQAKCKASKAHRLDGKTAKVTWNAQIPDPDSPKQPRQIDVLIEVLMNNVPSLRAEGVRVWAVVSVCPLDTRTSLK